MAGCSVFALTPWNLNESNQGELNLGQIVGVVQSVACAEWCS